MQPVSSSDSSTDDTSAEQYRNEDGNSNVFKFKEAQVQALRADPLPRQSTPPKKPRSNANDYQTAASRTRSAQPQQQQMRTQTPMSAGQPQLDNRETKDLRRLLHSALAQLDASSRRLAQSDAERRALESSQLAQAAQTVQTVSVVQQHAAQAQAELNLCKLQMEHAQEETRRTQEAVRTLEGQRDDAERAATRARAVARKLHAEKMSILAKEEGRREGYETGFGHGRMIAVAREQRRRQIEVASPSAREAGGAFIEEDSSEGMGIVRGDSSRGLPRAEPPSQQPQRRRRRESSDSVPTIQPRPAVEPEPIIIHDAQPAPPRGPASAMSTSSVRRVSAPPAVRSPSLDSRNGQPPRGDPRSEHPASRASTAHGPAAVPVPPNRNGAATSRSNVASRNSLGFPSGGSVNNASGSNNNGQNARSSIITSHGLPSGGASAAGAFTNNNFSQNARNSIANRPHRRSTSAFDLDSQLGLGSEPRFMPVDAMMPRTIPMPMPPPLAPPAQPYIVPMQQQHVPMPPPPLGAMSMPIPVPAPAPTQPAPPLMQPQPLPQFEVEQVGPGPSAERRDPRSRSPSSVSTSLRALHLTSFPAAAGPGSDRDGAAPRDRDLGLRGAGMGVGAGAGEPRARELSVILEHAEGSPAGSQLGNANAWDAQPRRQTPWGRQGQGTRESSPYPDQRGMEEWRRRTDEEAPRQNQLPPLSPLTSPGMLSPLDVRPTYANTNMHVHPSKESFRTDLRRSSSGTTVNITIVPPSRPTSFDQSAGLPTQGSGGFLSPNHAEDTPVLPDEDEDEDDADDDEDEDDDNDAGLPPGFVMSPLPAFAQGVTYPVDFVPMSVAPAPQPLPPFVPTGPPGRPMGGGMSAGEPAPATGAAPPPIDVSAGPGYSQPPSRPLSRQMGGGGTESVASTWVAPAPKGGGVSEPPPRPLSRQIGGTVDAAAAAPWGAPLGFVEQPPHSQSPQMVDILAAAPVPANAPHTTFGGNVPEPIPRPLSRQMGENIILNEPDRILVQHRHPIPQPVDAASSPLVVEDDYKVTVREAARRFEGKLEERQEEKGKGKGKAAVAPHPTTPGFVRAVVAKWNPSPPGLVPSRSWELLRPQEEFVSGTVVSPG